MVIKAQPPDPAFTISPAADEVLEWLGNLPEGPTKEAEKRRLLKTRFRALTPAPRTAGRPSCLDLAAVGLVARQPALARALHDARPGLARRRLLEPAVAQAVRTAPVVLSAWRQYRSGLGFERRDPPTEIVIAALRTALRRRRAPDIPELAARLLAWELGLPAETSARRIRKLMSRGQALARSGYF